ncbi:hypothetical protein BC941DRAFT_408708 [Chlamydoabsidia padenii]|nr:hypothetical protein BC941DRAFT_408708 [Chlamydoabsidia padenii]
MDYSRLNLFKNKESMVSSSSSKKSNTNVYDTNDPQPSHHQNSSSSICIHSPFKFTPRTRSQLIPHSHENKRPTNSPAIRPVISTSTNLFQTHTASPAKTIKIEGDGNQRGNLIEQVDDGQEQPGEQLDSHKMKDLSRDLTCKLDLIQTHIDSMALNIHALRQDNFMDGTNTALMDKHPFETDLAKMADHARRCIKLELDYTKATIDSNKNCIGRLLQILQSPPSPAQDPLPMIIKKQPTKKVNKRPQKNNTMVLVAHSRDLANQIALTRTISCNRINVIESTLDEVYNQYVKTSTLKEQHTRKETNLANILELNSQLKINQVTKRKEMERYKEQRRNDVSLATSILESLKSHHMVADDTQSMMTKLNNNKEKSKLLIARVVSVHVKIMNQRKEVEKMKKESQELTLPFKEKVSTSTKRKSSRIKQIQTQKKKAPVATPDYTLSAYTSSSSVLTDPFLTQLIMGNSFEYRIIFLPSVPCRLKYHTNKNSCNIPPPQKNTS